MVYYVECLNHNLFSVGQFCDADLEVAFRITVRTHKGTEFLNKTLNAFFKKEGIEHQTSTAQTPKQNSVVERRNLCANSWLWRFGSRNVTINMVYYVEGLNHNLFSVGQFCDADLEVAFRITVRTHRGTEFLNKTLNAFFKKEGIEHQTSTAQTPKQNGVVERRNRTLVEAARTMLSASQLSLFFWAEAIATACYTKNRSIIILTHDKTPYHIINDWKPSIKHLHIFGCICYITKDGKNLDKMKEKGDQCILVGYSTQLKGYRVYHKRTRMIVESIHICFDEIKEVSETSVANNTLGLSTSAPSTHINVHAEENNNDQAEEGEQLQDDKFTNPFRAPAHKQAESSSHNIGNTNVSTFNQPHVSEYRWTKDHPLEQVRGNPSRPVQTRRQLTTDPEMCMYALTVSTAEPKNIKEAIADLAWIEAMREELHQFDRL
nr:retrovirus-related Pol polyprotein from transposon TNT 1-94 [Tanacetum cinerariifolium]